MSKEDKIIDIIIPCYNAHRFGFILRYPKGKEAITGFNYEPWHFRYVTKELAEELHENNETLEEYYRMKKAR